MSEITLKSLKGRLYHNYIKTWSQVDDYKLVAEQALAEIICSELKYYSNPSLHKIIDILSNPTPKENLSQAEIDVCFFFFKGKDSNVKLMHTLFDNRVKEFEEYEFQELEAKPQIKRDIYEEQLKAWEIIFDSEAKNKWRKSKGL